MVTRREFLDALAVGAAGLAVSSTAKSYAQIMGSNDRLNFAVMGLGDSSYQKYNFAGKKLYRRLLQLGAKPLLDLGLADDQDELGVDGVLEPWRAELWRTIAKHLVNARGVQPRMLVQGLADELGVRINDGRT